MEEIKNLLRFWKKLIFQITNPISATSD
jgi:hypothetical protein